MKITLGILKTAKGENSVKEKVIEGIQDNVDYFDQIVYTGSEEFFEDTDLDVECLNLNTDNKAVMRNTILENAKNNYIMWISDTTILEFDMIPEMMEYFEKNPETDIVYPNITVVDNQGKDKVIRLNDLYGKEKDILMTLKPESHFPEYGIITKKETLEKLGKFDEEFADYEFYEFLYQNIKNLKLKLSEFNYVIVYSLEPFIDTSYRSFSLRKALKKYPLQEFFPRLNWETENIAIATAYTSIGDVLSDYLDLFNASEFYRKAALSFPNKLSLYKLANTYYNMGFFEEAKKVASTEQGFSEGEIENFLYTVEKIQQLITAVEKAIEEGKAQEVLTVINDIAIHYTGAPLYNILGVIEYYSGNIENAYKFFYKAATINPIDDNIIYNLTDVANKLNKKEEVKGLFKRILN